MFARALILTLVTAVLAIGAARSAPMLAALLKPDATDTSASADAAAEGPTPVLGDSRQVALRRDASGHFFTDAVVNGRTVAFLVDTGATLVALDAATARRLGYPLPPSAFRHVASTANGTVSVASITLREVRIGGIAVRDVEAMVLPEGALDGSLLGMSFLNRLRSYSVEGEQLVMRK